MFCHSIPGLNGPDSAARLARLNAAALAGGVPTAAKGLIEEAVEIIERLVVPNRRHVVDVKSFSKVGRLS